jgi:pyridoxamine 5'-phosphate oxidase
MVLLKGFDSDGFVFFTSTTSQKGRELQDNPKVALVFHWPYLERQVRITGQADRVPEEQAQLYFASRPRGSQLGAVVSSQSEVIASRAVLEERLAEATLHYAGQPVPKPAEWGGYQVRPAVIEFWQGREDRLHDRFRYTRGSEGVWAIERLSP